MFIWDIIKVIILGIIQGITEWLPISSTGHLILFEDLLQLKTVSNGFFDVFKVVIQFGSIIAVIVLYFKTLFPYKKIENTDYKKSFKNDSILFFKSMANDTKTWRLWFKIVIACLPAALLGFLFEDIIDGVLSSNYVIAATLILYGLAFLWLENTKHKVKYETTESITPKTAFLIGCFQSLALIPGTSRSGSTILGATLLKTSRPAAAEFSFFLAVPVMFGASALKLISGSSVFSLEEWVLILIGTVVSFAVSMIAIKFLMSYIKKHSFVIFGWYRILLGIVVLMSMGWSKLLG